jgi:hypothetical protein
VLKTMLIIRPLSLMEIVHIELPDERREVVMLKESGKDSLAELILFLDDERLTVRCPCNNRIIFLILQTHTHK